MRFRGGVRHGRLSHTGVSTWHRADRQSPPASVGHGCEDGASSVSPCGSTLAANYTTLTGMTNAYFTLTAGLSGITVRGDDPWSVTAQLGATHCILSLSPVSKIGSPKELAVAPGERKFPIWGCRQQPCMASLQLTVNDTCQARIGSR